MRLWLREVRLQREYTQQQVADMVGISRSYYTQLECMNGKGLSPKTAQGIGQALGFDWVCFYEEDRAAEVLTPVISIKNRQFFVS